MSYPYGSGAIEIARLLITLTCPATSAQVSAASALDKLELSKRDDGNTIVAIEHNLVAIKTAEWLIGISREGGAGACRFVLVIRPSWQAVVRSQPTDGARPWRY